MFFDTRLPVKCCAWNYLGCSRVLFTRLATGLALWSCCLASTQVTDGSHLSVGGGCLACWGGSWLLTRCLLPKFSGGLLSFSGSLGGACSSCWVSFRVEAASVLSLHVSPGRRAALALPRRRRVYGT